ncbi:MAG: hypothetical protein IJO40_04740 [Thermoguttaceae bacterium]|nr:hypothetical protein [Thermoguttaceae bacterium]
MEAPRTFAGRVFLILPEKSGERKSAGGDSCRFWHGFGETKKSVAATPFSSPTEARRGRKKRRVGWDAAFFVIF